MHKTNLKKNSLRPVTKMELFNITRITKHINILLIRYVKTQPGNMLGQDVIKILGSLFMVLIESKGWSGFSQINKLIIKNLWIY